MLTGPNVILVLKVAVVAVSLLLLTSLLALSRGNYRWHGRINLACFVLTAAALLGLEVVARLVDPRLFSYFEADPALKRALGIHLRFSIPATAVMPFLLLSGLRQRRTLHLLLAGTFSIFWTGTVITGLFLLPHSP